MKENILLDKSLKFAARIVKLNKYLIKEKKKQLFQSKQFVPEQALVQMQMKRFTVYQKQILYQNCRFLLRKQQKQNIG